MISEIGLDTVWAGEKASLERQIPLFKAQLQIAQEAAKPVSLHTKGAEELILEILQEYTLPGVLIHWYDGPPGLAEEFLRRGCFFTIPPAILRRREYREWVAAMPGERLLPETDNPGAWPWLFHRPGRPEQIKKVYKEYARMVGKSPRILHNQFKENLKALLQL